MSHASVLVAVKCSKDDIEKAVGAQMAPFDENSGPDAGWFRHGSRWDGWQIGGRYKGKLLGGDVAQRADLTAEAMRVANQKRAEASWRDWLNEREFMRPFWEMPADMTRERWIEQHIQRKVTAFAFLREKRWYENERLGMFGGRASTECALAGRKEGKCIVGKLDEPPCIIGFNEEQEHWAEHFWSRFVENLPAETWLVLVDYHV